MKQDKKDNTRFRDRDIEQAIIDYCTNFGYGLGSDFLDLFCLTKYSSGINPKITGLVRDIRINLVFCYIDYRMAGDFRIKMIKQRNNNRLFYAAAIVYQHHVSNFIFRFRALGDKIMRLAVFINCSFEEIKQFDKARSKIRTFLTICENNKKLRNYTDLPEIFKVLNEQYRTDEAHGMGGNLRNYIFTDKGDSVNDPIIQIGNYWNILTGRLGLFRKIYETSLKSVLK